MYKVENIMLKRMYYFKKNGSKCHSREFLCNFCEFLSHSRESGNPGSKKEYGFP